jgi:hypothetical protein
MTCIYGRSPYRLHIGIQGVRVIAINAAFNNISVISWRSLLLVEETEVIHTGV